MISIVMPMRNAMPFLNECITSIINQTFSDWELIVINDHSTDSSFDVLSDFAQQDPRITVINATGKGIIDALQQAYSKSTGDYITRMDADDIMPEQKLELMHNQLLKNPEAVVTGKIKYIGENLRDGYKNYETWMNTMMENHTHYDFMYKECVIPSPAWMTSRQTFEYIGGFSPNIYPEDYDLTLRFYKSKIEIIALNEVIHIWRDYQERTSRNDPNYSVNSFEAIKTKYFIEVDYDSSKTLVLWGAGKKGKKIAQHLLQANIPFIFACNNSKKINKDIYGLIMQDIDSIFNSSDLYQTIIAVANPEEQTEIKSRLDTDLTHVHPYWFC